jgi:DNA-binding response OmpR family regulator
MSTSSDRQRPNGGIVDAMSGWLGRDRSGLSPVLLLQPDLESALQLASKLEAANFPVSVKVNAESALQAMKRASFFALVVVADLPNPDCLAALKSFRRAAMGSWMIVGTPSCDARACQIIHRHGGDGCIALPISADDLIARLDALSIRSRPTL